MSDPLDIDRVSGATQGAGAAEDAPPAAESKGGDSALVLTPPAPVQLVAGSQAREAIKLDPAAIGRLDGMVGAYLDGVAGLDIHDPKFDARVTEIRTMGDEDIRAAAKVSSRLLDRPIAAMQHGGIAGTSTVSKSLIQLRRQIDDLDPAHQGDLLSPRKVLGILPFGDRLRDYFAKYRSGQGHLNGIINALYDGQKTLQHDNADLELEKANLWSIMERLRQYIYLAQKLDAGLSARVEQVEPSDPERARVLREDMLFYVRQKLEDLTTQLAVSVQGYLALDVIRRNNQELIKGVDRATTTTISALRTAIIVAQALADQKLVLDQIAALNTTTSNLIESTSVMLRQQSGAINEQAAASTIDLQKLQTAFDNIYATIDEIDTFRLKALDSMQQTVNVLTDQIGKAQPYLERFRAAEGSHEDSGGLTLK